MAGPSGQTARLALPFPIPDDSVDVPRDIRALADKLDIGTPTTAQGTLAARPAAGTAGRFYFSTDTLEQFYDTGTEWVPAGSIERGGIALPSGTYDLSASWLMVAGTNVRLPGLVRGQVFDVDFGMNMVGGNAGAAAAAFLVVYPLARAGETLRSYALTNSQAVVAGGSGGTAGSSIRWPVRTGEDGEHRIAIYVTGNGVGPYAVGGGGSYMRWRIHRDLNLEDTAAQLSSITIP